MKLTEKQKLRKRLTAFCGMLGDDLNTLDAALVTRINQTIERLGTPTKVAIAGLSDSHHAELAEFLIGDTLFNSEDEKQKCPFIQVRYGKEPKTHAIFGEVRKSYPGVALSVALGGKVPDAIGLEIPNPIAADIGFMILPAYDGDDNRAGYLVNLLDDTESIVWCSSATEIWQPKERRLWFTVPDTLKENSILALTGAENVTDDATRTTLNEKRAFIEEDFCHLTPIFIDAAKTASSNGKVTDAAQFKSSGGEALLKQITSIVQRSQTELLEEARALRIELDKIPLGGAQPVPTEPLAAVAPIAATTPSAPEAAPEVEDTPIVDAAPDVSPEEALKTVVLAKTNLCRTAVEECTKNDFAPVFEPISDLLSDIQSAIQGDLTLDRDQALMKTQVEEAAELVGLLSYENNDKAAQEAADITRQIVTDIWARLPSNAADATNTADSKKLSAAS